jgi:hypothetical protein
VTVYADGQGQSEIRIKIWDKTLGAVLLDTQMGAPDDGPDGNPFLPTTLLGGGSIVIHRH